MVLNKDKFVYIGMALIKRGWGYYRREGSTIVWWVDPLLTQDFRMKGAYKIMRIQEGWDEPTE